MGGQRFAILELSNPNDFIAPIGDEAYVAVLWAAATNKFDHAGRVQVATTLIKSGCRYVVCGGADCELWHDDADLAWLYRDLEPDPASSGSAPPFMTTWHTGQTEGEVLDFAVNCTNFDDHDFRPCLVLLIGPEPMRRGLWEELLRTIE
jgi:hypothetical protein